MEMLISNIVSDIALIIIAAALFSFVVRYLKQPLLVGYIIAGLVIGPVGLNYISNENTILAVSELGITFLLFLVGLELNINRVKEVGEVVVFGGMLQIALTGAFGWAISHLLGFSIMQSLYLALVLAFSSTLVVVKSLAEKREIDALHGRIIIGILVLQDIVAIMAISLLPTLNDFKISSIGFAALSGIGLLVIAYVLSRFALKRIFDQAAKNVEMLFLTSLAVCFIFAYLATLMGFSVTIGAFLAGVIIANMPYSVDIIARVRPLSTFFSALFFVALGMQIVPKSIPLMIIPFAVLTVAAVVIKPILLYPIIQFFGYNKKTSFMTALSLGQVSEFSHIVVAQGIILKHLAPDILSLIIALTVITMAISSYLNSNGLILFHKLEGKLGIFDRMFKIKDKLDVEKAPAMDNVDVVINGYENVEGTLLERFMNSGKKVLIIDSDPDVIRKLRELKLNCMYGDLAEHDIFEKVDISKLEIIMSSVPDMHNNMFIVKKVRELNKKAILIVTANRVGESIELYNAGADYVVIPHMEGEKQVAVLLEDFNKDMSKVLSNKIKHIEQLRKRQTIKQQMLANNGSFFQDIDAIIKDIANGIKESGKLLEEQMGQKAKNKAKQAAVSLDAIANPKAANSKDVSGAADSKKAVGQEA